jgi:hypothetical protein
VPSAPAAVESRRLTRSLLVLALALVGVLALGACTGAKEGDPELPSGMLEAGLPDVDVSMALYVSAGSPVAVPASMLGAQIDGSLPVVSIQAVAADPVSDFAGRFVFADATSAAVALTLAEQKVASDGAAWTLGSANALLIGHSSETWGAPVRTAWTTGVPVSIEEKAPEAWTALRLLPESVPGDAVAAGFATNVSAMVDRILESGDVSVSGLDSALSLVRVSTVAFAAYADGLTTLPTEATASGAAEAGAGVIAVAQAGYPGPIINMLLGQFAGRIGLEKVTVGGQAAYYKALEGGLHLYAVTYGATFYFAIAADQTQAEGLVGAVVRSQARRGGSDVKVESIKQG